MRKPKVQILSASIDPRWGYGLLLLLTIVTLAFVLVQQPIPQDQSYHQFADRRSFHGIPNTFNLLSNIPFAVVGLYGVRISMSMPILETKRSWAVFFIAAALVGVGSAIYHWHPTNPTLVWDRLPMAIAFMALLVAFLSDHLKLRISALLLPAIFSGVCSILYWHLFDDLRFYAWIQFFPFFIIPTIMILYRSRYTHRSIFMAALAFYAAAKLAELFDAELFKATQGFISGHSLKHLLAAAGIYLMAFMLKKRRKTGLTMDQEST